MSEHICEGFLDNPKQCHGEFLCEFFTAQVMGKNTFHVSAFIRFFNLPFDCRNESEAIQHDGTKLMRKFSDGNNALTGKFYQRFNFLLHLTKVGLFILALKILLEPKHAEL